MQSLQGSPLGGPRGLCILLLLAVYLICQCAVNYATFRDACQKDTRWSMLFNVINFFMAAALIAFVCAKLYKAQPAAMGVSSDVSADAADADGARLLFG